MDIKGCWEMGGGRVVGLTKMGSIFRSAKRQDQLSIIKGCLHLNLTSQISIRERAMLPHRGINIEGLEWRVGWNLTVGGDFKKCPCCMS